MLYDPLSQGIGSKAYAQQELEDNYKLANNGRNFYSDLAKANYNPGWLESAGYNFLGGMEQGLGGSMQTAAEFIDNPYINNLLKNNGQWLSNKGDDIAMQYGLRPEYNEKGVADLYNAGAFSDPRGIWGTIWNSAGLSAPQLAATAAATAIPGVGELAAGKKIAEGAEAAANAGKILSGAETLAVNSPRLAKAYEMLTKGAVGNIVGGAFSGASEAASDVTDMIPELYQQAAEQGLDDAQTKAYVREHLGNAFAKETAGLSVADAIGMGITRNAMRGFPGLGLKDRAKLSALGLGVEGGKEGFSEVGQNIAKNEELSKYAANIYDPTTWTDSENSAFALGALSALGMGAGPAAINTAFNPDYYKMMQDVMGKHKSDEQTNDTDTSEQTEQAGNVARLTNIANLAAKEAGLPDPKLVFGQLMLESANGSSALATNDNNFGGIKGTDGEYMSFKSDEDFAHELAGRLSQYSGLKTAKTPEEYAAALKHRDEDGAMYYTASESDYGAGIANRMGMYGGAEIDFGTPGTPVDIATVAVPENDSVDITGINEGFRGKLGNAIAEYQRTYGLSDKPVLITSTTGGSHVSDAHRNGTAADMVFNGDNDIWENPEERKRFIEICRKHGLDVFDEYENNSPLKTGNHLHVTDDGGPDPTGAPKAARTPFSVAGTPTGATPPQRKQDVVAPPPASTTPTDITSGPLGGSEPTQTPTQEPTAIQAPIQQEPTEPIAPAGEPSTGPNTSPLSGGKTAPAIQPQQPQQPPQANQPSQSQPQTSQTPVEPIEIPQAKAGVDNVRYGGGNDVSFNHNGKGFADIGKAVNAAGGTLQGAGGNGNPITAVASFPNPQQAEAFAKGLGWDNGQQGGAYSPIGRTPARPEPQAQSQPIAQPVPQQPTQNGNDTNAPTSPQNPLGGEQGANASVSAPSSTNPATDPSVTSQGNPTDTTQPTGAGSIVSGPQGETSTSTASGTDSPTAKPTNGASATTQSGASSTTANPSGGGVSEGTTEPTNEPVATQNTDTKPSEEPAPTQATAPTEKPTKPTETSTQATPAEDKPAEGKSTEDTYPTKGEPISNPTDTTQPLNGTSEPRNVDVKPVRKVTRQRLEISELAERICHLEIGSSQIRMLAINLIKTCPKELQNWDWEKLGWKGEYQYGKAVRNSAESPSAGTVDWDDKPSLTNFLNTIAAYSSLKPKAFCQYLTNFYNQKKDEQSILANGLKKLFGKAGIEVRVLGDDDFIAYRKRRGSKRPSLDSAACFIPYGYDTHSNLRGTLVFRKTWMTAGTVAHEYIHMWDEICRHTNPKLWKRGCQLMKEAGLLTRMRQSGNYTEYRISSAKFDNEDNFVQDEDVFDVCSEAHAQFAGPETSSLLSFLANGSKEERSLYEKLKNWAKTFWNYIKSMLHTDDYANLTVDEFVKMPLADLAYNAEGFNIRNTIGQLLLNEDYEKLFEFLKSCPNATKSVNMEKLSVGFTEAKLDNDVGKLALNRSHLLGILAKNAIEANDITYGELASQIEGLILGNDGPMFAKDYKELEGLRKNNSVGMVSELPEPLIGQNPNFNKGSFPKVLNKTIITNVLDCLYKSDPNNVFLSSQHLALRYEPKKLFHKNELANLIADLTLLGCKTALNHKDFDSWKQAMFGNIYKTYLSEQFMRPLWDAIVRMTDSNTMTFPKTHDGWTGASANIVSYLLDNKALDDLGELNEFRNAMAIFAAEYIERYQPDVAKGNGYTPFKNPKHNVEAMEDIEDVTSTYTKIINDIEFGNDQTQYSTLEDAIKNAKELGENAIAKIKEISSGQYVDLSPEQVVKYIDSIEQAVENKVNELQAADDTTGGSINGWGGNSGIASLAGMFGGATNDTNSTVVESGTSTETATQDGLERDTGEGRADGGTGEVSSSGVQSGGPTSGSGVRNGGTASGRTRGHSKGSTTKRTRNPVGGGSTRTSKAGNPPVEGTTEGTGTATNTESTNAQVDQRKGKNGRFGSLASLRGRMSSAFEQNKINDREHSNIAPKAQLALSPTKTLSALPAPLTEEELVAAYNQWLKDSGNKQGGNNATAVQRQVKPFTTAGQKIEQAASKAKSVVAPRIGKAANFVNDKALKPLGYDLQPPSEQPAEDVKVIAPEGDKFSNEISLLAQLGASPQRMRARLSDKHPVKAIIAMASRAYEKLAKVRTHFLNLYHGIISDMNDEDKGKLYDFLFYIDALKPVDEKGNPVAKDKKFVEEAMNAAGFSKGMKHKYKLIRQMFNHVHRMLNAAVLRKFRFAYDKDLDYDTLERLLQLSEGRMSSNTKNNTVPDHKFIEFVERPSITYTDPNTNTEITINNPTLADLEKAVSRAGSKASVTINGGAKWNATTKYSAKQRESWIHRRKFTTPNEAEEWAKRLMDNVGDYGAILGIETANGKTVVNYTVDNQPLGYTQAYMPHLWHQWKVFGKYKDSNGNEGTVCLGSARTMVEAVALGNQMKGEKWENGKLKYTNIEVRPKMFSFETLGQNDAEMAAKLGLGEYIAMANQISARGAMSIERASYLVNGKIGKTSYQRFLGNLKERKGAKGYESKDADWAITTYLSMASRYIAMETEFKPIAVDMFENAYGSIDGKYDGDAAWVQRYINDINGNPSTLEQKINYILQHSKFWKNYVVPFYGDRAALTLANSLTNKMSHLMLGFFRVSTCLLNLSQIVNAAPYIGDLDSYVKILGRAARMAKYSLPKQRQQWKVWERNVLKDTGVMSNITLDSASGYDKNRGGFFHNPANKAERAINKIADFGMKPFTISDQAIRVGTVLAAYESFMKKAGLPTSMDKSMTADEKKQWMAKHKQAIEFAKDVNRKANFDYSVADAPDIFRRTSIIGQLVLQFKKYPVKELEVIKDMLPFFSDAVSAEQKAMFWIPFMLMCGMMGMPAGDLLDDVFYSIKGYHLKTKVKKGIMEANLPEWMKRTMLYGIAGAPSFGVDVSQRVGVADVIPTNTGNVVGPAARKTGDLLTAVANLDLRAFMKVFMPATLNDLLATAKGSSEDARGRKNMDYDITQLWAKAIGARPVRESVSADKAVIQKQERRLRRQEEKDAIDAYIKEPSAKNAKLIGELGITQKRIADERKQKAKTRTERTKAGLSKQETKDFEFMDFMNEDD